MARKSRHDMTRAEVLRHALEIAADYEGQGLILTLRQMYYQFVSRGLTGSGQDIYKRIGETLTEARYLGEFPIEMLEDRGRDVTAGDYTDTQLDVEKALDDATAYVTSIPRWTITAARWYRQPHHVSVWVEKKALAGVFEDPCRKLGVGMFPCAGYPSVSSLWDYLKQLQAAHEANPGVQRATVLYFGDHDPDGWEIPASAERGLDRLVNNLGICVPPIRFERVALNMDQIIKFNPPPFDAKVTSSRYTAYVENHGTTDAWELDALEPSELRRLIETSVRRYFNPDIYHDNQLTADGRRDAVRDAMVADGWTARAFGR